MPSRLKFLVAFSLLLLVSTNPRPVSEAPLITPSGTGVQDWSLLRKLTDEKAMRDVAWFQAASAPTTTQPEPSQQRAESVAISYEPGTVEALVCATFGRACAAAVRVARCESTFNPNAVNGRYRGVFQVGDMHVDEWFAVTGKDYWESWMVAELNVSYAYALYQRLGWGPWACKP